MKINKKVVFISLVVFVCLFGISIYAQAATVTFTESQLQHDPTGQIPNLPTDPDTTYYGDSATAAKLCSLKGGQLVTFITGKFFSCYDNYVAYWTGFSWVTVNSCSGHNSYFKSLTCTVPPVCATHTSKQCSGSAVYWYNSCGTREDIFQACTANQTCSNGQCINVNIACSANSECGTNGVVGSPFCANGDVYRSYRTYTCNNAGTANSSCTNSTVDQLVTDCIANQTCSNGSCSTTPTIACSTNANCGTNSLTGNPFCQGNSVYQNYITYTCNNAGTANSYCSNSTATQLKNNCVGNQTCSNGQCVQKPNSLVASCYATPNPSKTDQTVSFIANVAGGTANYVYSWSGACTGSSQVCSELFTQTGTYNAILSVTSGGQSAHALCSAVVNQNCSSHYSKRCLGNDVYWYNSCGNQEGIFQDCTTTNKICSNGQCNDNGNNNTNIVCSSNSACGTNGYTGSPYCQGNDVYQNYITYICNNPGTANSYCSNSTATQLKNNCAGSQTCSNGYCSTQQNYITVQTNSATNTYNNQATLNGYFSGTNTNDTNYVWFQWGTTTSYGYNGYETNHQTKNYTGSFSQNIAGLTSGVVYHFRAVAQSYNGQIVYGQDMTFQLGQVLGATDVNTGLTNNFLVDSFFLPLMIALAGIWLFKSGILNTGAWVDGKKIKRKDYIANKELMTKISQIKERENR